MRVPDGDWWVYTNDGSAQILFEAPDLAMHVDADGAWHWIAEQTLGVGPFDGGTPELEVIVAPGVVVHVPVDRFGVRVPRDTRRRFPG